MNDIESDLTRDLHAQLDALAAPPDLASAARARLPQVRRARQASRAAAVLVLSAVAAGVYAVPHWRRDPRPDQLAGPTVSAPAGLVTRTEQYLHGFARGDFTTIRERMTPTARVLLTEEELRALWSALDSQLGGFRAVRAAREEPTALGSLVSAEVVFADAVAYARVEYSSGGDVSAVVLTTEPGNVSGDEVRTDLGRHARQLVAKLAARDYAWVRRDFDMTMRRQLTAAKLRAGWDEVVRTHGQFVRLDGLTEREVGRNTVVRVLCVFANGLVEARVTYDSELHVAGLYLLPARDN
ncbi:MAG: DUF3887 domain-containing protein [Mycobacteriales bacterium]